MNTEALSYHRRDRAGKIEVTPTKPCSSQRDLSLAYTPGVAEPCRVIAADPASAYEYTAKGNLVAVVSNGTAVLGLGAIGPLAGKPVMEGKGVLFKKFADIDVFDLEIDTTDTDELVRTVKLLEPTFGGINLEDIAAPACFDVEERLAAQMSIPVFHDDQHGTAIIGGAALLNALELQGKRLESARIVVCGAGAAGIASARLLVAMGARREQIVLTDTAGVVYRGREHKMNRRKEEFATDERCRTLSEALRGADVFLGVSGPGVVTGEMLVGMAPRPIVLALANPDPEIPYDEARLARPDAIVATGRSDFPNQVNNVLGFPFIFRGALDVRARAINLEMKLAAMRALADLARQPVPDSVARAYGDTHFRFGPDYIIPKPFDRRVLLWESAAVADAAMKTGAARIELDLDEYRERLERKWGLAREAVRVFMRKARSEPHAIVFPEGTSVRILRAASEVVEERIARPILLGAAKDVRAAAAKAEIGLTGMQIIDPAVSPRREEYAEELFRLRQRRGITRVQASDLVLQPDVFGALMVRTNDADGLVSGATQHYPDTVRPMLQIIGLRDGVNRAVGVFLLSFRQKTYFVADATINMEPDAETLADIAVQVAGLARSFSVEPRVAMLSFSNFGSVDNRMTRLVQRATRLVREREPGLVVDGEMQADTAVVPELAAKFFPFSSIQGDANVLIFPDLTSSNIAYKLLHRLGGAEVVGPILLGMARPVAVLHQSSEVSDIVHLTALIASGGVGTSREAVKPEPELARSL
jgi:malate dehydrogenase (oxaloacetate-decarboxylating)(NADP+)